MQTTTTSAPDSATAFGDPHVGNLKGERFDILQPDYHTFMLIPRGSAADKAQLHVRARVAPLGNLCDGFLYVTELQFTGLWLGEVQKLEFITRVDAGIDAQEAMKVKVGHSNKSMNVSAFRASVPEKLAQVTEFHPEPPESVNNHVDTLLVKLRLGPSVAKVRMVYQKEKVGYSNALWITSSGLRRVEAEIGGILGLDDHNFASSAPQKCHKAENGALLLRVPRGRGTVHASASLDG